MRRQARCRANRGTRGSRCNKASRERNTPRRQRLPLQLQSSSISRGRQIKLLTQYPLYPYNKNKYDRSELSSPATIFQVSLSLPFLSSLRTLFATREKICETMRASLYLLLVPLFPFYYYF